MTKLMIYLLIVFFLTYIELNYVDSLDISANSNIDVLCIDNVCQNNASCMPNPNSSNEYLCNCQPGYTGRWCHLRKISGGNPCIPNPCLNGASCKRSGESPFEYKCNCPIGWIGDRCQTNVDDCKHNPCRNGGICIDLPNHKYQCKCESPYIGMHCDHRKPCASDLPNPCGVHGDCTYDTSGNFKCICKSGYTGDTCSIDIDECVISDAPPCENNGKCINTMGSYRCECPPGYSGDRCDNDIRECNNNTCKNGGTCLDKIGRYECGCTENFRGNNCEIPISVCEKRPCKNNGLCREAGNNFFCNCGAGWRGKTCTIPYTPCDSNPCLNNGKCRPTGYGPDSYQCTCMEGFTGLQCQININDCSEIKCLNGGKCRDLTNGYRCECPSGYEGRYCEERIDNCKTQPCQNGAKCIDLINDYECKCPFGLAGRNCQINVDDCADSPCMNDGVCVDRVGGYVCRCSSGYVGLRCERPNDICGQLKPCINGAVCVNDANFNNGYRCICPPNSNINCIASNQPALKAQCKNMQCYNGGKCEVVDGKEKCICRSGYFGEKCEKERNKCRDNPCQHGGSCQNLNGNYFCECQPGYEGDNCETNTDDCDSNPCGFNGRCIDMVNGYRCQCHPPYTGSRCQDKLDPCLSNNCQHDAMCIPTRNYNNYSCRCTMAFGRYEGDLCEKDVDECHLNNTELIQYNLISKPVNNSNNYNNQGPCFNGAQCINTDGSFVCKCPLGFSGYQCEVNINDCANSPCFNGATCRDLVNGYQCHCVAGFTGKNCETEINECSPNPCQNGAKCFDHINDYQCICKSGFSGKNCEINDNDCSESSCTGNGKCIDQINGFQCKCNAGYYGDYCQHLKKPCDNNPCANNGSCNNVEIKSNQPGYSCNCKRGFTGPRCELKMDWCHGSPCGDNGKCIATEDSFKCHCNPGYVGNKCEIKQSENCRNYAIRKFNNASLTNKICQNNGHCVDEATADVGFRCLCGSGYSGSFCETNEDNCADQPCQNGGICHDRVGMYYCDCPPGFQGIDCQQNRNECSTNHCKHGICVDQVDKSSCICPPGISGRYCENVQNYCKDMKCHNGGQCINKINGAQCRCVNGFSGQFCEVDINECRYRSNGELIESVSASDDHPLGPCSPVGTMECLDGRGEANCRCKDRFYGKYCEKRNPDACELETQSGRYTCLNGGRCIPLKGDVGKVDNGKINYRCECPVGYGGEKCEIFSAACLIKREDRCLNGGICRPVNRTGVLTTEAVLGSKWQCECPAGLGGLRCELDYVNECVDSGEKFVCYNGGKCQDGLGRAYCKCLSGICGERCELNDVNLCNNRTDANLKQKLSIYNKELTTCQQNQCSVKAENKRCDLECNNLACGFDGGECLHRVPQVVGGNSVKLASPWQNCSVIKTKNIPCHHLFNNGKCDQQCNTESCLFDGWDCQDKMPNCPKPDFCNRRFENNHCDMECNIPECNYDGGDCFHGPKSNISGAIILILRVSVNEFVSQWEQKLLSSLSQLLHSLVRVKRYNDGEKMIFPIRVFAQTNQQSNTMDSSMKVVSRQKRSGKGQQGTKVYLELENSICKQRSKSSCFDNTKDAADFVSASLYHKSYLPPVPIFSVQSDSGYKFKKPTNFRDILIYIILVMFCIAVVGILLGVLYGLSQNKNQSVPKKRTCKAEIWFPDNMKRSRNNCQNSSTNLSAMSDSNKLNRHRNKLLLSSNGSGLISGTNNNINNNNNNSMLLNRKRSAGIMNTSDITNNINTISNTTNSSSLEDNSGSNSLTSTRITSYYDPAISSTPTNNVENGHNNLINSNPLTDSHHNVFYDDCNNNNDDGINPVNNNNNINNNSKNNNNGFGGTSSSFENNIYNNSGENIRLLGSEINYNNNNFHPTDGKQRMKLQRNDLTHLRPDFEACCFNAIKHLIVSGSGLGDLTLSESHDKQIMLEKLINTAAAAGITANGNNNSTHGAWFGLINLDGKNMNDVFTNTILMTILTMTDSETEETLLHFAAKHNRREATKFLLEAGSNPNAIDVTGRSCIMTAVDAGAYEVVAYFLEQQVFQIDVHLKGPSGTTCLMQAVKGAHIEIVHLLIQYMQPDECDLNITDDAGRTALHWAAATDQAGLVHLLLTFGFNRDAQDHEEMTPLYLASREGCIDVVQVLLAGGANQDMSDHLDRLPIDVARAGGLTDVVVILERHATMSKETQHAARLGWGAGGNVGPNNLAGAYHHYHHQHHPAHIHPSSTNPNLWNATNPQNALLYNPSAKLNPLLYKMEPYSSPQTSQSHLFHHQQHQSQPHHQNLYHTNYQTPTATLINSNQQALFHHYPNPPPTATINGSSSGGHNNNITPSPDSESPGHWSTSSPSLSPHSRNLQTNNNLLNSNTSTILQHPHHQQHQLLYNNNNDINPFKSSVLHYRPVSKYPEDSKLIQNNALYTYHT